MKYFLIIISSLLVILMAGPCRADQKAEKMTNNLNIDQYIEYMRFTSLRHALHNSDWKDRAYAASLLGNFNNPRVPKLLARSMKDPQESVRLGAVTGLGRLQRADMLIPALTDRSWLVRRLARSIMEKARMSNKMQLDVHLAPGQFMAGLIYQQPSFFKAISRFVNKWQVMEQNRKYYFLPSIIVGLILYYVLQFRILFMQFVRNNKKIVNIIFFPFIIIFLIIRGILRSIRDEETYVESEIDHTGFFIFMLLFFFLKLLYKGIRYEWTWWISAGYTKYYFIIPSVIVITLIIMRFRRLRHRKFLVAIIGLVLTFLFEPLLFMFLSFIKDPSNSLITNIAFYMYSRTSSIKYYLLVALLVTIVLLLGRYSLSSGSLSTGRIRLSKITIFLLVLAGFTLTFLVQPFVASINYLLELPGTTLPIVSILLGTLALYSWLFLFFTPTVAVVTSPLTLFAASWRRAKRVAAGAICPSCAVRRFDYEKKELPLAVRLSSRWLAREVPEKHKDFLDYFRCGKCKGREKMTGVRTLVGVIGNGPDKPEKRGSEAVVSLWDNRNEKSRYADIDRLEIRESDGVRYDMAINSVILTLHDRSGKPSGYLRKIPVRIIGNPPIPVGSMNILEQQFRKITRE